MNAIEIELRYVVLDKNQLTLFLAPLKFLRSKQDIDIYYDNADVLLLRKKDFNHYLLGRFILEEDKVYRIRQ